MNSDDLEFLVDAQSEERQRRQDVIRLIRWIFPPEVQDTAIAVCRRSSGFQSLAFHRRSLTGIGLFDIDPALVGIPPDQAWRLHNPVVNVTYAYKLFKSSGWRYWDETEPQPALPEFDDPKG